MKRPSNSDDDDLIFLKAIKIDDYNHFWRIYEQSDRPFLIKEPSDLAAFEDKNNTIELLIASDTGEAYGAMVYGLEANSEAPVFILHYFAVSQKMASGGDITQDFQGKIARKMGERLQELMEDDHMPDQFALKLSSSHGDTIRALENAGLKPIAEDGQESLIWSVELDGLPELYKEASRKAAANIDFSANLPESLQKNEPPKEGILKRLALWLPLTLRDWGKPASKKDPEPTIKVLEVRTPSWEMGDFVSVQKSRPKEFRLGEEELAAYRDSEEAIITLLAKYNNEPVGSCIYSCLRNRDTPYVVTNHLAISTHLQDGRPLLQTERQKILGALINNVQMAMRTHSKQQIIVPVDIEDTDLRSLLKKHGFKVPQNSAVGEVLSDRLTLEEDNLSIDQKDELRKQASILDLGQFELRFESNEIFLVGNDGYKGNDVIPPPKNLSAKELLLNMATKLTNITNVPWDVSYLDEQRKHAPYYHNMERVLPTKDLMLRTREPVENPTAYKDALRTLFGIQQNAPWHPLEGATKDGHMSIPAEWVRPIHLEPSQQLQDNVKALLYSSPQHLSIGSTESSYIGLLNIAWKKQENGKWDYLVSDRANHDNKTRAMLSAAPAEVVQALQNIGEQKSSLALLRAVAEKLRSFGSEGR